MKRLNLKDSYLTNNSIPPEKQLAVNSIPAELYTDDGVGTVDADQEK